MSDLRELVEEWRGESNKSEKYNKNPQGFQKAKTLRDCANDLEDWLDQQSGSADELTVSVDVDTSDAQEAIQELKAELRSLSPEVERTNATIHEPYGARSGGITDD